MRMRDKPTVAVEISIAAPPARVWELVTDLQLMGHWSPEYQGGEWLDGATGPMLGARFKGRNKRLGREWESVSTVLEELRQVGPLCGLWAILPILPPPGALTSRPTAVGRRYANTCSSVLARPD